MWHPSVASFNAVGFAGLGLYLCERFDSGFSRRGVVHAVGNARPSKLQYSTVRPAARERPLCCRAASAERVKGCMSGHALPLADDLRTIAAIAWCRPPDAFQSLPLSCWFDLVTLEPAGSGLS